MESSFNDLDVVTEELKVIHSFFSDFFRKKTRRSIKPALQYLQGQILLNERGNMMNIEKVVPDCNHQSLKHFISNSQWDEEGVICEIQRQVSELIGNHVNDRKVRSVSEEKRYDYGDAHLVDYTVELEDSSDKGYIFKTRAVQVHWDNGRTSVLVTSVPEAIFSTDNVVKSYFDRWPAQGLNFKDLKGGVNIHRVVGYGKKLMDNIKVLEKIERLQGQISGFERELEVPLNEIRSTERKLQ